MLSRKGSNLTNWLLLIVIISSVLYGVQAQNNLQKLTTVALKFVGACALGNL